MTEKDAPAAPDHPRAAPGLDRRMLEALVCPITHGPLAFDAARLELVSRNAGLAFPIRDGIPIMLPDEARALDD
ncbi:MAG: Trm112 family protein [Rubrimonas sp.]|uniref:Trm112 family protein n=1 Tax=Rubrimonas sp. TaxID=2036015 RepID=UPI003DCCC018